MTENFESEIGEDAELEDRGQATHDHWTKNSVHFFGALASFNHYVKYVTNKNIEFISAAKIVLLACSPISFKEAREG